MQRKTQQSKEKRLLSLHALQLFRRQEEARGGSHHPVTPGVQRRQEDAEALEHRQGLGGSRAQGNRRQDLLPLSRVRQESLLTVHLQLAHENSHWRAPIHLPPVRKAISRSSGLGASSA